MTDDQIDTVRPDSKVTPLELEAAGERSTRQANDVLYHCLVSEEHTKLWHTLVEVKHRLLSTCVEERLRMQQDRVSSDSELEYSIAVRDMIRTMIAELDSIVEAYVGK